MKVKVKVIGLDSEKISLSIKQLKDNPWDVLAKKVKTGDTIKAPISRISQFGAFMDLDGGIQGLIHLSEISHHVVKDIRDHVKVGEEVEAKIINFEPQKKRIGLSLKALQPVPEGMKEESKPKVKEGPSEEDKIDAEVAPKKAKKDDASAEKKPAAKAKKEAASE
jgi:ribosomal protein S1